jgi:hypothetical protein
MNAKILDSRTDGESQCFLCRISLEEYVSGLPSTYQDYDVQREIVSNVYLDHLVDTVLGRKHIPPIVLVVEAGEYSRKKDELQIQQFKILDGLQRTFRLQAIRETVRYSLETINVPADYLGWNKFKFSRKFSAALRELNSNTDVFRSVLQGQHDLGREGLLATFGENGQWFEVWTGLTPEEEVRKMLTLNAGHKPVKTRHQLELLFLNLLPILRAGEGAGFKLVREKEVSSTQFSKDRECGSFHFAHIISSLLSFYAAKPVAPSAGLIQNIQSSETGLEEYGEFTSPEFLKDFVAFLVRMDRLLQEQYGPVGVLWMGREVSLAGLFGGLGSIAEGADESRQVVIKRFGALVKSNPGVLNLDQFETERNSLDLSKVNIGNVNRAAVFNAVKSLFSGAVPEKIDWQKHFRADRQ